MPAKSKSVAPSPATTWTPKKHHKTDAEESEEDEISSNRSHSFSEEEEEDEEDFDVEKILASRTDERGVLYHVKWRGYDSSENTWELREDLIHDGHSDAVSAYENSSANHSQRSAPASAKSSKSSATPRARSKTPVRGKLDARAEPDAAVATSSRRSETKTSNPIYPALVFITILAVTISLSNTATDPIGHLLFRPSPAWWCLIFALSRGFGDHVKTRSTVAAIAWLGVLYALECVEPVFGRFQEPTTLYYATSLAVLAWLLCTAAGCDLAAGRGFLGAAAAAYASAWLKSRSYIDFGPSSPAEHVDWTFVYLGIWMVVGCFGRAHARKWHLTKAVEFFNAAAVLYFVSAPIMEPSSFGQLPREIARWVALVAMTVKGL